MPATMAPSARADAREAYERALGLFLRGAGDPRSALDLALAADPHFAPALLLLAAMAVASKERTALAVLDEALARLAPLEPQFDERERGHLAAAYAWRAGSPGRAASLYADVARRWPHDLLAVRLAQSCRFLLGDAQGLHDVAAEAVRHWRDGMPGYDCALALYAFGLEEIGECDRAQATGRRALELERRNPVAVHAVAHALTSAGDPRAGLAWMEDRVADWDDGGSMASHNWWHVALFHLALGRPARALAVYDASIAPAAAGSTINAADAAALLWRLELDGVDVGRRWHPVADAFALRPMPALWPLIDVHAAMALAAAGRARELDRLTSALAGAGQVARDVALPLARALEAFATGEHADCAALLAKHRHDAWRLGGSHVQREIVDLTFAAARARAAGAERREAAAA